ncbi:MAG: hypothetical protein HFI45_17335 [Lachnospiraceae bacterium]|nr:hypothetical protein [Lachnospiraceae bacterium]
MENKRETEWIYCPVCGSKTRLQIRLDTKRKLSLMMNG